VFKSGTLISSKVWASQSKNSQAKQLRGKQSSVPNHVVYRKTQSALKEGQ
jgi:hypothetical protein